MMVLILLMIVMVDRYALKCDGSSTKSTEAEIAEREAAIRAADAKAEAARNNLDAIIASDTATPNETALGEERLARELFRVGQAEDRLTAVKRKHVAEVDKVVEMYQSDIREIDSAGATYERSYLVRANPHLASADIKTLREAYNTKREHDDNSRARRETFLYEKRAHAADIANRLEVAIASRDDLIHRGAAISLIQSANDEIAVITQSSG